MAKKKRFGIAVTHPDGSVGWLIDYKTLHSLTFPNEKLAAARLEEYLKDKRYSWSLPVCVAEYLEVSEIGEQVQN